MSEQLTFSQAFDQVVAEAGRQYVYQRPTSLNNVEPICRYEQHGQADCLIGRTLFKMGVTIEQLREMDRQKDLRASKVMEHLGVGTYLERRGADAAQSKQDTGSTWGCAQDFYHQVIDRGGLWKAEDM